MSGKAPQQAGDVEMTMQDRRRRIGARQMDDLCRRVYLLGDQRGNLGECRRAAGDAEQHADAAPVQHPLRQLDQIVDEDVIAPLFAVAEQGDLAVLLAHAPKAVRAVGAVGVGKTVDQRRPDHGETAGHGRPQQHLAGQMHGAIGRVRLGLGVVGDPLRVVAIDRIRAEINDVTAGRLRGRSDKMVAHRQVLHGRAEIASFVRSPARQHDRRVRRAQPAGERFVGTILREVDFGGAHRQDGDAVFA